MTPKEKAQELYWKFFNAQAKENEPYVCDGEIAINCALIAVDEIIKIDPYTRRYRPFFQPTYNNVLQYWKEVKQEIQKL